MIAPGAKINPVQEQEVTDFLVALHRDDDEYLSLDLSRQALSNNFSYVRDEAHADSLLHHFRDRKTLAWRELSPSRWRWVRAEDECMNQPAFIEAPAQVQLRFSPAPDESVRSPEFQSGLGTLMYALRTEDVKVSQRWFTQDAVGAGGWVTGELTLMATTLGPVAIVQLRKGIIEFLKMRQGRKLKLKIGPLTIEGHAEDVEKFLTPEQIAKALEPSSTSAKKSADA